MRPGAAQAGVKRRAMAILKQKRMYEMQREQVYQQQFNVEQTAFATDTVKANIQTVKAMKAATKEFKQTFGKAKELDLDAIDNMQDEMAEMMEISNEINDALGRTYDVPEDIDEDDLMDELDALEFEMQEEDLTKEAEVPAYMQEPDLPTAPTSAVPAYEEPAIPAQQELDNYGLPAVQN